jgi:hypothetical protein
MGGSPPPLRLASSWRSTVMPPVSEKQRKAMGAAASGRSTLGIPKSVGKEFIKADKGGKLPRISRKAKRSK